MIYFVATPIGNLKDITFRAIEVLNSVDVIACEDTRNSLKLLNFYKISKKLISYHKFNEKNSAEGIINLAKQNKDVAVISDAGMPLISDPGHILVNKLIENNINYTVIPGASACLSGLILSGFDSSFFTFIGFLDENNKIRKNQIEKIKDIKSTLIFYVSPYNLEKDVMFLHENLGDRKACLVNEITKIHEKKIYFNLSKLPEIKIKGEYVLIVEGRVKEDKIFERTPKQELDELLRKGIKKNEAIKMVAKARHIPKREIYKLTIDEIENN